MRACALTSESEDWHQEIQVTLNLLAMEYLRFELIMGPVTEFILFKKATRS